jgi:group I intron endonuclease
MSVYIIVNLENDKAYIGQTRGPLDVRFKQHCEPNKTTKSILTQAIYKHGIDAFYMEALWESPECSQEQLDTKEIELIREYNTQSPHGYNITAGGRGMMAPSEETRRKMAESARKKFLENPELRENLSKGVSERNRSEDVRRRHSETMKQKYKNDENFRNHVNTMNGKRVVTGEAIENARRGLIRSIEEHPERFRKIYVFDKHRKLAETFTKLADAERAGYNRGSVVRCIKSGALFRKEVYFSYSSTLPPVTTRETAEESRLDTESET